MPQAVVTQRLGKVRGEPVVDDAALLAGQDEAGGAQQTQRVGDGVLADLEGEGEVTDAEFLGDVDVVGAVLAFSSQPAPSASQTL